MEVVLIGLVALGASALTLFSGFGLGTILTPAFALFFPLPAAIAATAIVHLANNLFKLALLGRHAHWPTVARFGLPAALAAVFGAGTLALLDDLAPLASYRVGAQTYEITALKLIIGTLIAAFAAAELHPGFKSVALPARYMPAGGLLSGFFGGLSGNQGAFRAAFLIKAGLDKKAFVGTGVACAVIVDTVRLAVYGLSYYGAKLAVLPTGVVAPLLVAILCAFLGAFMGTRLLDKITLRGVQIVVALTMAVIGTGLAAGLI